ncbi:GTP-binding protein Rho1 [Ascosphaera pollenicola]|nr:GTP-binding protein Rho1 [Ascosphaera pollenicola]
MASSPHPQLKLDQLYVISRYASQQIWGEVYPESVTMDDNENFTPLQMLHNNNLLRSRIWQLATAIAEENPIRDSKEKIWRDLEKTAQHYSNILKTALCPPENETRRVFFTMRCAASYYCAQILFHRQMLDPNGPLLTLHVTAVSNIIQIARYDYARGVRFLSLHVWGLLVAGISLDDPMLAENEEDRQWIVDRLAELKGLHSESPWASKALEQAIREKRGDKIDLLKLFTI